MKIWLSPKVTTIGRWVYEEHPEFPVPADGDNVTRGLAHAAKGCYKSFGADGRPCEDNQRALLEHGHGCYDEYTEVLTTEGWLSWPTVTGKETFYTLNKDNKVELHKATGHTAYLHEGKMYKVSSPEVDLLVTPNHNLYVSEHRGQPFRLRKAEDLDEEYHIYNRVSSGWAEGEEDIEPKVWELVGFAAGKEIHLMGDYLDFGYLSDLDAGYLDSLVTSLGFVALRTGLISIPEKYAHMFSPGVAPMVPERTESCLYQLRGLSWACGYREVSSGGIAASDERMVGHIQTLAMLCGLGCRIERGVAKSGPHTGKSISVCHLETENTQPAISKGRQEVEWVPFSGMVYCVEVPNNTLYIRRNDKAVWCGNSVLEHASVSFYVEGVTRALTLEMNRHRHLSISQESTRYVDEGNSGIVLEPYLAALYTRVQKGWASREEGELVARHLQSSEEAIREYSRQVDMLEELNPLSLEGFDLRKWARGKARNILPHNLESKITYTANLRAWRHFLELRSERHAEPEIRRLCSYIYHELKRYAPLYFDDEQYEIEMFPQTDIKWYPLFPEYKPRHRKV